MQVNERVEQASRLRFGFGVPTAALRLSALAIFAACLVVSAQPVPKINSVSPEWIQRGTTVDVVFTGENLGAVTGFIFSGDSGLSATNVLPPTPPKPVVTIESNLGGISKGEPAPAKDDKRLVARVMATADASLSAREVRTVTTMGVSNPLQLNVGQWPEVREKEPNNTPEQAQLITLPASVSGSISAAAQVDFYRFKASKGQELIFDVDASERGSPLDSSLALLTAGGTELARSEDVNGLDSLLVFAIAEDGEYLVQIRDFRYQGGGNFAYRLHAGALPYLQSMFPFGGQRGKAVEVTLTGRNLADTSKMLLNIASSSPLGRQEIRANTPNGYSNLRPFDVSDLVDFLETEPNNTTDKVNTVSIPVVINGRIGGEKDIDRFKFKVGQDQKLVCEVLASRFGLRLDALLILSDAMGNTITQNDDSAVTDARIEFDGKKDVEYVLSLRDLTERGGDDFAYRLAIRPPSPDVGAGFTARFQPDTPRVSRGSHSKIQCEITPLGGFGGAVRFAFEGLPPGVFSEPLVLTVGVPSSGLMLLSASKEAPLGASRIELTATANVNGKNITRRAEPMQGEKSVREGFLTVLDSAPFTLELITLSASVEQNQTATIEVMAQRREGFTGDIKLSAEGFSAGKEPITKSFNVAEVTLKGNESLGKMTFTAKQDSEVGTRTLVIRGDDTVDGQPVTQYSRPMPVSVSQVPFVISSVLSRLSVTALPPGSQSAAGETSTTIKLDRRAGFTNEVLLTLEGMPAGINSVLDKIPANTNETILKLTATEKAAIGTNFSFTVLGAAMHNDRNYKHRSAAITLIVSAPDAGPTPPPAVPAARSAK